MGENYLKEAIGKYTEILENMAAKTRANKNSFSASDSFRESEDGKLSGLSFAICEFDKIFGKFK